MEKDYNKTIINYAFLSIANLTIHLPYIMGSFWLLNRLKLFQAYFHIKLYGMPHKMVLSYKLNTEY